VERLHSTGTVLGLFKDWDCPAAECPFYPGDTFVLYTDGVTESCNVAGEEFGEQRLLDSLQQRRELPAHRLLAFVVDEIQKFSPHEQHDDITLIIANCKETPQLRLPTMLTP
jgi:serine phosphatase RsbU (regulator of sigma subunit)